MNWLIGIATVGVAVAGLLLANSYRRQMALKLSHTRLEAYSRLWEITGVAAPSRLEGWGDDGYLRPEELRDLWVAMTDWYYADGGGMLLRADTQKVYLNVKHDLICKWSELQPKGLAEEIKPAPPDGKELDDEKVRGILAIRLVSLLRTQLKSDLAIYGSDPSGKLDGYELFFLDHSGVDLGSKTWASGAGRATWRRRLSRPLAVAGRWLKVKPPDSSEHKLFGNTEVLEAGEAPRTPPSSRMAMENALRGRFRTPAEADSGISKILRRL